MTEAQSVLMLLITCLTAFVTSLLIKRLTIAIACSLAISSLNAAAWVIYGIVVNWIPSLGMQQLIGALIMIVIMIIPSNLSAAAAGLGIARATRFAATTLLGKREVRGQQVNR